ncbi:class F sortase [Cryptosporangium arvum]|uniref:class F sortase n=1 Tax=Cryptosporangium arvum TaxID=80871 RepID=UPI0004B3D823|nr:class F sortase [Cryptosporangium arvum]
MSEPRRFLLPNRRKFSLPAPDRSSRWPAYAGLATGIVCLAAAAIYALLPPPAPDLPSEVGVVPGESAQAAPKSPSPGRPSTSPRSVGPPSPSTAKPTGKLTVPPDPAVARPRRLKIPVLDVDAVVDSEIVNTVGGLSLPDDPRRVGWWSAGAGPGSTFGSVILAGHVDDRDLGRGALYDIGKLSVGDLIWVDSTAGRRAYRVAARRVYQKAKLPGDVFAQGVPERLVLVTCTSPYDRKTQSYEANVVVYASPATG